MTFHLSDLLLFPAIIQGIFIAAVLVLKKNGNKHINRVLSALVICSAFMLTGRMIYDRFPTDWMLQIAFVPDIIIFLFGPLTYLFVVRLFTKGPAKFIYLHYIPAAVYFLMIAYFFTFGAQQFNLLVTTLAIWDVIFCIETTGLISNLGYSLVCVIFILKYRSQAKEAISFQQPVVAFVRTYLIAIILCQMFWLGSFISTYFIGYMSPIVNYSTIWFSMPFASYIVGYYMIIKPPVFLWNLSINKKGSARMPLLLVDQLKEKINDAIVNQQVYTKEDLTLTELADIVGTSTHNLSWLLNDVYKQSFYDFINALRIEAFISKVEQAEHIQKTILSLALEVGFKSKSTFNKSFKAIYNNTPSRYIKEHYTEMPTKLRYSA